MNTDLYHLLGSVATLAAIVTLVVTGHGSPDIVNPLLVIIGGQVGFKLGASKNESKLG